MLTYKWLQLETNNKMHVTKNVTTINNFYTLEPILIILGTLYAETTGF